MASNAAHVSLYVSQALREAIERSAALNDRSLSAEVRGALRAYISSNPSAVSFRQVTAAEGKEDREW